jgi:hypothetical protein
VSRAGRGPGDSVERTGKGRGPLGGGADHRSYRLPIGSMSIFTGVPQMRSTS